MTGVQTCALPISAASERAADPELLRAAFAAAGSVGVIATANLREALQAAAFDRVVLLTGSLQFVGEAMELLGLLPSGVVSERGLNEWVAPI